MSGTANTQIQVFQESLHALVAAELQFGYSGPWIVGRPTYFAFYDETLTGLIPVKGADPIDNEDFVTKGFLDAYDYDNRVTNLEERYEYYEIFESTNSGSGTVTKPTNSTIILNFYPEGVDALVAKLDTQGRPLDEPVYTAGGVLVTTTFDTNGNYVLSGTPSAYPVGIVYFIKIQSQYSDNVNVTQLVQQLQIGDEHTANKATSFTTINNTLYPSVQAANNNDIKVQNIAVGCAVLGW